MQQYILRRLLLIPILIIGITMLDFVFINLAPGDPVTAMIDPTVRVHMSPAEIQARREALGLTKPLYIRYGIWLWELSHGNLGYSIIKSQPVAVMMWNGIQNTIALMALSLVITSILGIVLGIISALRPYSILDYLLTTAAFAGIGMPSFFFALILILVGSLQLGWFPTSGIATPGIPPSITDRLMHMVLPLIALSINGVAGLMRYTRSSMLEVLHEEYVTTARSKGLAERVVTSRHALKNALLPVITILGLHVPQLFGGAVIIETIYNIPGIGSITVEAMNTRDYPIIMGSVLMAGIVVLVSNLLTDLSYAVADPRIRY
jgi:peptide/nickel transport system permease protein